MIRLADKDLKSEKLISTYKVDVAELADGHPKCMWLKLAPAKGVKSGGFLGVAMQIAPYGQTIDLRAYIVEPVPKDVTF